jgi:hypothetical protein
MVNPASTCFHDRIMGSDSVVEVSVVADHCHGVNPSEQIKNNMGGGWCQPPCATLSDGRLETTAPQGQSHGASFLHLLLGATRAQGSLLELLTGLTTSGVHQHVTSGLQELLRSHLEPRVVFARGVPPMNIVWHPPDPSTSPSVPPLKLS